MNAPLAGFATNAYQGAASNRLMGSAWRVWDNDPNDDWTSDALILAQRAWDLVRNDPVMAALLSAKIVGTHGACGMRMRSLYQADANVKATEDELRIRKEIEGVIAEASQGTQLDANGFATRHELEEGIDELATTSGEAFAVRCYLEDRPGAAVATCWRLVRMERVCNPPGTPDSDRLYNGIALDRDGQAEGLWIAPPRRTFMRSTVEQWTYVPWFAPDGSRNVLHRIGRRVPGSYRGVSLFAACLPTAKQVKGLLEAYVVAKRVQACHPIIIECDDPVAAAKKDANGAVLGPNTVLEPGKFYYVGRGAGVSFPSWAFGGADMQAFIDTLYRNEFASWGMPIDVVLAQLGRTNMAASRSAWQQYYRQCTRWQDDHIEQVSRPLDEAIVREAVARGRLTFPAGMSWQRIMASRYVRPEQSMPDPLKEANAVAAWVALGRDKTGLWGESGVDFRESVQQRADDDAFEAEHGITPKPAEAAALPAAAPADQPPAPAEDVPADAPADDAADPANQDDQA